MSLSVLPTALLLPPVNLLLPCLAGALVLRRRPWTGRALLAAGLGGLLLLSMPAVSNPLLRSLEAGLPLAPPPGADPPAAIIILSAEAVLDGAVQIPGPLTLERLRAGAALHRRTGLPVLVTGGAIDGPDGKPGPDTLADMMARSLQADFGIPARWTERQSQDTRQNAVLSAPLLGGAGIRSAYLVTHAWHMPRSVLAFEGTGIAVTAAPVRLDPARGREASDFVPRARAWLDSYYALHEWVGLLAARVLPDRALPEAPAVPPAAVPQVAATG